MIRLLKKFYQFLFNRENPIKTELELLKSEVRRLQEDQITLSSFCKDILLVRLKQMDKMQKDIISVPKQFNQVNKLIDQHADAINSLIDNFKKHVNNPYAHEHSGDEVKEGKKQRNDN